MNMSPHDRPKVSTNVANKPELNVPVANAVGINFDNAEPLQQMRDKARTMIKNKGRSQVMKRKGKKSDRNLTNNSLYLHYPFKGLYTNVGEKVSNDVLCRSDRPKIVLIVHSCGTINK